jgi:hypothetical protein
MMLSEVDEFKTDKQFTEVKDLVYSLVRTGELRECGLDPKDPWHFVEVFKSMDGAEWHMAVPDHAFRGYLKKVH